MVEYKCFRCGYTTYHKGSLVNHLKRKNICNPILNNISIENIQKYYGTTPKTTTKRQHEPNEPTTPKRHTKRQKNRIVLYLN